MSINIGNLISVCVQLAQQGCKIVKESYMNKQVKKFQKGFDDPVTQADFKIQTMIVQGLNLFFPKLKIIGEQTTQYQGKIQFDYQSLCKQYLPKNIQINRQQSIEDLCVWIDPIDCTKGFIDGIVQCVTVLIGITYKKRPTIGIIGIPYKIINKQLIYKPSVIFGSVKDKIAYQYISDKQKNKGQWFLVQKKKSQPKNITMVCNHPSRKYVNKLGNQLKIDIVQQAGAGRKIIMVIKQQVQMMGYIKCPTQKWDSCAGQAIILALGGYFSTPFGQELIYKQYNTPNSDGFICTLDQSLFDQTVKFVSNNYK